MATRFQFNPAILIVAAALLCASASFASAATTTHLGFNQTQFTLQAGVDSSNPTAILALDGSNNVDTNYSGPVTLVFSSSGNVASLSGATPTIGEEPIGSNVTVMFSNGSSTNLTMDFQSAYNSPFSLSVSEAPGTCVNSNCNNTNSTGNATFSVSPGPVSQLTVVGSPNYSILAGTLLSLNLVANDSFGNIATNFTGVQQVTAQGSVPDSPNGTIPTINGVEFGSPAPVDFSSGISLNGDLVISLFDEGVDSFNLTTSSGSIGTASNLAVSVNPGPVAYFNESGGPSGSLPRAQPFTSLILSAVDAYGNIATGYNGIESLTFTTNATSNSNASGNWVNNVPFGTPTSIAFLSGQSVSGNISILLNDAGNWTVNATNGTSGWFGSDNEIPLAMVGAPTISSVQITFLGSYSSTATWTTDEASTSYVEYGTDSSMGSQTAVQDSPASTSGVTSHSVNLDGLSPSTTYYYAVVSCDSSGECSTSATSTFSTESAGATPTPTPTPTATPTPSTTTTTLGQSTSSNGSVGSTGPTVTPPATSTSPAGSDNTWPIMVILVVVILLAAGAYLYLKNQNKRYYR